MGKPMESLMNTICDYLDSCETDRLERTNDLLDFLNYNRRLAELSAEERQDFVHCMEGYPLTDVQRAKLDTATPAKRNDYIESWARGTYFRRCDWMQYLHGEKPNKPPMLMFKPTATTNQAGGTNE